MKKGNIFWGVILLTFGVLLALRNFDIFYFSWYSIFRLWPLIFVFWGISILPVKSFIKLTLIAITIFFAIIILVRNPNPDYHWFWKWDKWDTYEYNKEYDDDDDREYDEYDWEEQHLSAAHDSGTINARLNLNAAAGKFYIKNISSGLFEFDSEGDAGPYNVKTIRDDNTATIDINLKKRYIRHGNITNDVWLALNPGPVWNLNIDVGAASLEMDLSPFKTEKIDIDGGASKIELKIGDKLNNIKVNIDAGASAIIIKIPYESACELHTSTVLSAREIDDFNKIKSGLYQTPNFSDSANQIFIDIDAAISSLKVERY